jgi:hypothetical protein
VATPTTPLPSAVETWISRARYLRWLDALAAWLILLAVVAALLPDQPGGVVALSSLALVAIGAILHPLRLRWRPVTGWVGVTVSRSLRPGQRAWFVRDGHADAVLVTGRRGLRVSIAAPNVGVEETLSVRRTRVFLIPI